MLSVFGTLIAIHTIIAAQTGVFLLKTQRLDIYLASKSDFTLIGSQTSRVGSFLLNPDANSTFLAIIVFITLGLFMESSSRLAKFIYLSELILVLIALLFTYSTSSWVAVAGGMLVFMVLVGNIRDSFLLIVISCTTVIIGILGFPLQLSLFIQHATEPSEAMVRLGAWETAIRVINAYPLSGIGLGTISNYIIRAEPYRVPAQYIPLAHPHNSYLELAAMAGIPALIVFLTIVGHLFWLALRNWRMAERKYRPLLGGAITALIVLSINSLAINGWTLSPLVVVAWLIFGVISSAALTQPSSGMLINREKSQTK